MDMMHIPGLCDFTGTRDLATPIRGLGVSPWFTAHKVPPAHRLAGSTKAVSPALSIQAEPIHHHGQKQMLPQPEPEQTPPPETKISQQEEAMLPEAEESVLPPLHRDKVCKAVSAQQQDRHTPATPA